MRFGLINWIKWKWNCWLNKRRLKSLEKLNSWLQVIAVVAVASFVIEKQIDKRRIQRIIKEVDEALMVKRFWMIGKAWKDYRFNRRDIKWELCKY